MNETFYKKLTNGVQIVHRHSNSEVAYVGIMVGAGTRHEVPELNGMAHYIEHCVFKGVMHDGKPLSAKQLINRIEGIGGEINAYTTKEETTFYAAVPRHYFARTLRLISDMVLHPTFPKDETDKEVSVILDEIESYNDSPSELIYDDFESLIFDGSSLALPILGTKKTLRHLSQKASYAHEWMQRNYLPERIVVFSQGHIPFQKIEEQVEEIFGNIPPTQSAGNNAVAHSLPCEITLDANHASASYHKHTHQMHVMIGGKAYPLGHERQLGMYLMNNILGGGSLSSMLNMSIREQKGLVYTIESQYTPLSDTGYWNIYFASEPNHRQQCIDLIYAQLARLRERPFTPRQLSHAIKQLHGQMAISAENQENNVLAMAKQMLYYGKAPDWQETFHQIEQFTPDDLQQIAIELMQEKSLFSLFYE